MPLVFVDPDDPAAQAIRHTARGIIALTPVDLPMLATSPPAGPALNVIPPAPSGMSLPMAG